jgi:hypothetical protein
MTCGESASRSMVCAGANGCAWHPKTLSQALLPNNWGTLNPPLREFPSDSVGLTLIHTGRDFVNDGFAFVGLLAVALQTLVHGRSGCLNSRGIDRGGKGP